MPADSTWAEKQRNKLRILEIGFLPLLSRAFPDQVQFVDTRFRWEDPRTRLARGGSGIARLRLLAGQFARAWRLSNQAWDAVVTRCLGPVNSQGKALPLHAGLLALGWSLETLARRAACGSRAKLAVIDQTDHLTIHQRDRELARRCHLYFKRELAENHWCTLETLLPRGANLGAARADPKMKALRAKLRPFALGIDESQILEPLRSADKETDLFYAGTPDQLPARERMPELLAAAKRKGWRVFAPERRIPLADFREAVRTSRYCLSPGGVGWDCYRHYEVIAFGSVPIMNYRTIAAVAPFEHGRECFYFDPQGDLIGQIEPWLGLSAGQTDTLSKAAQKKLKGHYTFAALAQYVMDEITKLP
jgi:hypothetical protein